MRALHDAQDVPRGFPKIGQDVTERRKAEVKLRASEQLFRQFGEASVDALWIRDADTFRLDYMCPAFERIYDIARAESLQGAPVLQWLRQVHPKDRARVIDAIRRLRADEPVTHAYRILRRSDGALRWIRNADFPLFDPSGQVRRVGGVSHDATQEIETSERLQILVAELQHRTRNLLTVVCSIAAQTMGATRSSKAFHEQFSARLAALSRVQGLLSRAEEKPITLQALLEMEIAALAGAKRERLRLEGPLVRIRSSQVQTLALAFHELATNARKYGALSEAGGALRASWRRVGDERRESVAIEWREDGLAPGGTAGSERTPGGGYGRRLIEQALPYSLGARTTYELEPDRLRCTIELPLTPPVSGRR